MTAVDWSRFRKCPVCDAATGEPCLSLTGYVVVGDEAIGLEGGTVAVEADRPHGGRLLRVGYARTGGGS